MEVRQGASRQCDDGNNHHYAEEALNDFAVRHAGF